MLCRQVACHIQVLSKECFHKSFPQLTRRASTVASLRCSDTYRERYAALYTPERVRNHG